MNNYGWDNVPVENSDAYIEVRRRLSSTNEEFKSFLSLCEKSRFQGLVEIDSSNIAHCFLEKKL